LLVRIVKNAQILKNNVKVKSPIQRE
jgi:hypothetical protein